MKTLGLETNALHQGDCLHWLEQLETGVVDLAFADPPFNIGYTYDVYDDRKSADEYLEWCRDWMSQVHRVLKANGTFWLAIGDEFAAELKVLAQRDLGFSCRSWVIWYYTFGVNCKRGFSRSHTHLLHFVKDPRQFTFNAENPAVRVPSARQLVYADARANPRGRLPDNTWILRPQDAPAGGFATEHDTWYYPRVAGTFKERAGFHGCQMPEQILGRIIRLCSNPGDLVLDPFAGSGTTLVVAKKLGRHWLGTELSPEYATRVKQRLKETQVGAALEGVSDPLESAPKTAQGKQRKRPTPSEDAKSAPSTTIPKQLEPWLLDHLGDVAPIAWLVDPERQTEYQAVWKELEPDTTPEALNRALWDWLSTSGKAATLPTAHALLSVGSLDAFRPAAEAALTLVQRETRCELPDVLCHPERVSEFDAWAQAFAPEATVAELRWTAWTLLRQRHTAARRLSPGQLDALQRWRTRRLPRGQVLGTRLDTRPLDRGVMVLVDENKQTLLVSPTADLPEHAARFQTAPGWQKFQAAQVRWIREPHHPESLASVLTERLQPLLNLDPEL